MRISYARIENFRNFKKCEVNLGQNIVLIGENKAGKSNFITALRLVLDPLQNRQLVSDDFWGGSGYPFDGRSIQVTVRITDFGGENPDLVPLTWLSPCLIEKDPPIAQLTYLYYPDVNEEEQQLFPKQYTADDYKWMIYPIRHKLRFCGGCQMVERPMARAANCHKTSQRLDWWHGQEKSKFRATYTFKSGGSWSETADIAAG